MSETIIADSAFGQEELIEIEISEEFREMNLNGPGDSEMLEICLSDPNQIERKESNINFEPRDQIKLIDQPNGRLETPATTSRTFEVYNTPQYIPTQSLSPEELQPSTSRHCREISRSSEVYKQPQSISQLLPIQNLSLDELQPSTSKHCSTNSKTCEDYKQPQSTSQYIQPIVFRLKNYNPLLQDTAGKFQCLLKFTNNHNTHKQD
ncbi:unnamed protein product [Ceratitis capitata]|uniref:(Mediterranean fruit fly) hypothetical protein n=1 Tax=Ceratitis capitata TaxID=7213 RepID=A0A811UQA7_CERCA|nr:unnamed protein product [Ceratitis capitata]